MIEGKRESAVVKCINTGINLVKAYMIYYTALKVQAKEEKRLQGKKKGTHWLLREDGEDYVHVEKIYPWPLPRVYYCWCQYDDLDNLWTSHWKTVKNGKLCRVVGNRCFQHTKKGSYWIDRGSAIAYWEALDELLGCYVPIVKMNKRNECIKIGVNLVKAYMIFCTALRAQAKEEKRQQGKKKGTNWLLRKDGEDYMRVEKVYPWPLPRVYYFRCQYGFYAWPMVKDEEDEEYPDPWMMLKDGELYRVAGSCCFRHAKKGSYWIDYEYVVEAWKKIDNFLPNFSIFKINKWNEMEYARYAGLPYQTYEEQDDGTIYEYYGQDNFHIWELLSKRY